MPGGRPSSTGVTSEMLTGYVNQYISEEIEFDTKFSVTRYMIARSINNWYKEKIGPRPPYNLASRLYRILENRHNCKIDASNAYAGKVSPQVNGCRVKSMMDVTDRNQYEMNFCQYCYRLGSDDVQLVPATFGETGMECRDINDCVDYSQERLASGEQLPKPPDITKFPKGYKRLSAADKIKMQENRIVECDNLIEWLQSTLIHDRDRQIKYIRIKRSTARKEIRQQEMFIRNQPDEIKEHRAKWNRMGYGGRSDTHPAAPPPQ